MIYKRIDINVGTYFDEDVRDDQIQLELYSWRIKSPTWSSCAKESWDVVVCKEDIACKSLDTNQHFSVLLVDLMSQYSRQTL